MKGPWKTTRDQKPFGFLVTYEARIGGLLVQKTFRAKCCESQARSKCLFREGYIRLVRLEPLTAAEWERTAPAVQSGRRHYDRSLAGGRG